VDTSTEQGRQWSRQAAHYDDVFLDPFRPGVENPILSQLNAITDPGSKTAADLGCGTGPLLPFLVERFARVVALDFAPGMVERARARLGESASKVTFLKRPMDQLDDFEGQLDVVVAVNSIVMPDVREIDRTLRAIRLAIRPGGRFLGVVPAMDAIHYHTMLLMDSALDRGLGPEEAERLASFHAEHRYYDFAFGRFEFRGIQQKFWNRFEAEFRLRKAGFSHVAMSQVLYPWDESVPGGTEFADQPRSWDWSFVAAL
jgi:SAM-dependent methyltransferase